MNDGRGQLGLPCSLNNLSGGIDAFNYVEIAVGVGPQGLTNTRVRVTEWVSGITEHDI